MTNLIEFVTTHGAELVSAVLMILGGFSIIAKYTPTKADDKVLDAILKVIHTFGLTKK